MAQTRAKRLPAVLLSLLSTLVAALAPMACAGEGEAVEPATGAVRRALQEPALQELPADGLVISRVYGGGGNNGAPYNRDFVEIFNRSNVPAALAGLSIQYGGGTRNFGAVVGDAGVASGVFAFPDRTLDPGRYFLVALSMGSNGVALPGPIDGDGILALSATDGKIALARTASPLGCGGTSRCGDNPDIIDMVGYGSGTDYEWRATPALSNTNAAFRKGQGCVDANDNASDFTVGPAGSPPPRNSATPAVDCAAIADGGSDDAAGSDSGAADDAAADGGIGPRDAGRTSFDSGPPPRYIAGGAHIPNQLDATCTCRATGGPADARLGWTLLGAAALLFARTKRAKRLERTKRKKPPHAARGFSRSSCGHG